jgi:hypothetical protein
MSLLNSTASDYVETPAGIFTKNGNWYFMTSELIRRLSPEVLAHKSLDDIVKDSETWVRSSDSVAVWVFIVLIQFIPVPLAFITAIGALYVWHLGKSALISKPATVTINILSNESLVLIASVASISYLGINELYSDLFISLLFFLVLRFGWLRKLFDTFFQNRSKGMTLNDRVMKMVVVKTAITNRLEVPGLRTMEQEIIDAMTRNKSKKPRK